MTNRVQSETASNRVTELTAAELQAVAGGLNPQPLPPRWAFTMNLSNVAFRGIQSMFAFG
jgi:hypothetical protein